MKSGDNKTSDFEKNYLQAGTVRLVNVVISFRFEHLFLETYFIYAARGSWQKIIILYWENYFDNVQPL